MNRIKQKVFDSKRRIPSLTYKLPTKHNSPYSYCDYKHTISLGRPKYSHEISINHEVMHHVVFYIAYPILLSSLTFDRISSLLGSFQDKRFLLECGLPAWE